MSKLKGRLSALVNETPKSEKSESVQKRQKSHHEMVMDLGTEEKQKEQSVRQLNKYVDPSLIKIFPHRDRTKAWDDPSMFKDLTDSIQKKGDQINPAIVRQTDDPDKPYELIVGGRRLNACIQNNIPLLVTIKKLDDLECIKMITDENEANEDIKPFERALYAYDLWKSGLFNTQQELMETIGIPQSTLTERLGSAKITEHEFLYEFLEPIIDINVKKSLKLVQALSKKSNLLSAKTYVEKNYSSDSSLIGTPNKIIDDVLRHIESLENPKTKSTPILYEEIKIDGAIATLKRDRKGRVKIELEHFPENTEDFFIKLAKEAKKLV